MSSKRPQLVFRKECTKRVETGGLQFENDWPGYFIRGDDCGQFVVAVEELKSLIHNLPSKCRPGLESATRFLEMLVMSMKQETIGKWIQLPKEEY